jgi:hypothetical protein
MRVLAAAAVGLALAAPAAALRSPEAPPSELLEGATVVVPVGLKPRESPQRLALRVLLAASADARISFVQLFADGDELCAAHPEVACYAVSLGRLWYVRLVTRTVSRVAPPEAASVPRRIATVVAVDGGPMLRKPPVEP